MIRSFNLYSRSSRVHVHVRELIEPPITRSAARAESADRVHVKFETVCVEMFMIARQNESTKSDLALATAVSMH